jgi:hypothetical protein
LWSNRVQNGVMLFGVIGGYRLTKVGVGGANPHTRVVAQGLTPYCGHIVITFFAFLVKYFPIFQCYVKLSTYNLCIKL